MKIVQPTYICKQPSTGKNVEFRPFTNKEEKSLLLALQEEDIYTIAATIKNIISVCTDGKVNPLKVPYYDVEYLFMKIRAKSVGEIIDLEGGCGCGTEKKTEFSVNIDDTVVEPKPVKNPTIKIGGTPYSIILQHPNLDAIVESIEKDSEQATKTVASCIVSIFTDDEVLDWSEEETLEFVESMTTIQQKDIAKFIQEMPSVKLPTVYKCKACGTTHESVLTGFRNFFL